jgi:toxin ParE1/3/4
LRALIWSQSARRDLLDIVAYYSRVSPQLADELVDRIESAPLILCDYPDLGTPTIGRDVRKWLVPKTPFILFYRADRSRVAIRRVRHGASDWTGQAS